MRFSLIFSLCLLSGSVFAHEGAENPVERVNVPGIGSLSYQRLFEAVSEPGESLDGFVLRIAPRLRAYSDATGFEACGLLATDGERFGVVVGTNQSHIACANFKQIVPAGMNHTNQTVHSHGTDTPFKPNRSDYALSGAGLATTSHGKNSGRPLSVMSGQTLDEFSKSDFDGGPGYLAAPDGLVLFQNGSNSVRLVN